MRIDEIEHIAKHCTGCLACVDICPKKCITSKTDENGFIHSEIDSEKCIDCGKCAKVCPANTQNVNLLDKKLYAAFCKDKETRNNGSSGGAFECIARYCLENDYYICGAAFDKELKLKHKIVNDPAHLSPLLKSKYIQSDTEGIFEKITELLKTGNKVLFCGTPCQVSALKNCLGEKHLELLITVDIICHGVPSQTMFDDYIKTLGKKVSHFSFRVKDNKYKHPHGYSYTDNQNKTVNGIYTDSSFYNAFKNYSIFRESCYSCKYASPDRAGDITLGDFWGIEKYDFCKDTEGGVSMIITNTQKGQAVFEKIIDRIQYKEFPVEYGIESNHCLSRPTKKPKNYDAIFENYKKYGYADTAKKYFETHGLIQKIYWKMPSFLRNFIRKIRVK